MKEFEYFAPTSIQEALSLLGQYGERAKVLAGGTDLVLMMRDGILAPEYVIDITPIPELRRVQLDETRGLSIGGAATARVVETDPWIVANFPHLAEGAAEIGSIQIRNLGTLAGNIVNAVPSADIAPSLLALDARLRLATASGEREVPLIEFFTGPRKSVMRPDELLVEITVPLAPPRTSGHYLKLKERQKMDLAFVGVASTVTLEPGDTVCREAKIALGAVAPTPIRVPEAEQLLKGKPLEPRLLEEAGQLAARAARPISDVRASAEYRRAMVAVLTKRTLSMAVERAQQDTATTGRA